MEGKYNGLGEEEFSKILNFDSMEYQYSFEKLRVWKDAREFLSFIYRISQNFMSN